MKNAFRCAFQQVSLLLISLLLFNNVTFADSVPKGDPAKGEIVFKNNCSSCHQPTGKLIGPWLKGVYNRWTSYDKLKDFVHHPSKYIGKDPYLIKLQATFGGNIMAVPELTDEQVENVLAYANAGGETIIDRRNHNTYIPVPSSSSQLVKYMFFGVAAMFAAIFFLALRLLKTTKEKESINTL